MTLPARTISVMGRKLPSQGIGGVSPEFVAGFAAGDYRTGGTVSSFANTVNFARTGTATYTDATGTLQTAADGVARLSHHVWSGSAWVNEGLLLESDAATNLLTYSEQFDNAAWAATVVGSSTRVNTLGPYGFGLGLITATSSNGGVRRVFSGLTSGQPYTISFYLESATPTVSVVFENGTANYGSLHIATINPNTGGFSGVSGFTSTTSTAFGAGRIYTLVAADAGGALVANLEIRIPTSGDSILLGRPQFQAGSEATSYIKTEATAVTRNAETLTASSADLPYNTTAVSIQMEGAVNGASSTFLDWQADADNLISLTSGASDFTFTQERAGTVDSVTGGSYTSGTNVPFSIASRHGATFLNGAVDGVALTANTTPTALPDLTSTDLDIAPNFNGTIKLLRIWGADIGDAGIAEASA